MLKKGLLLLKNLAINLLKGWFKMTQQIIEEKGSMVLPSLESDMERMLEIKFKVRKDDFEPEEWRDLMTRCYGVIGDPKYDEIFDNVRHEASYFLMIRAFQKGPVFV
jgi:hypothetical protein